MRACVGTCPPLGWDSCSESWALGPEDSFLIRKFFRRQCSGDSCTEQGCSVLVSPGPELTWPRERGPHHWGPSKEGTAESRAVCQAKRGLSVAATLTFQQTLKIQIFLIQNIQKFQYGQLQCFSNSVCINQNPLQAGLGLTGPICSL